MRQVEGITSTSPARTMTSAQRPRAEPEVQRTARDVGELLVVVRVPRDNFAFLEIHVRNHHALAGDQLPRSPFLSCSAGMSSQRCKVMFGTVSAIIAHLLASSETVIDRHVETNGQPVRFVRETR